MENNFAEKEIERPEHWGGYSLQPNYIEFWQGREGRLHDRICYSLDTNGKWNTGRLAP
jgi:pyridoxamine 5'-phosphate oxidase